MKIAIFLILLALPLAAQGRRGGGRPDNAPKVGAAIPEASAVTLDSNKKVVLSKPEKLTVLIFGSHT